MFWIQLIGAGMLGLLAVVAFLTLLLTAVQWMAAPAQPYFDRWMAAIASKIPKPYQPRVARVIKIRPARQSVGARLRSASSELIRHLRQGQKRTAAGADRANPQRPIGYQP